MTITSKEIWRGRDGEADASQGAILYSRIFRVVTTDRYTEAYTIMASGLVPQPGDAYPYDTRATCRRVRPVNETFSPYVWIVTCSYSTQQSTAKADNPLNDRTKITWGSQDITTVLTKDRDGKGIVNSAGDLFVEGGVEEQDEMVVARITKNVAAVPDWIYQYRRSVNDSTINVGGLSIAPEKARFLHPTVSDVQTRNDIDYYIFGYELAIRDDGWIHEVLDRGFHKKDPVTKKLSRITNPKDMTDVSTPVLLNGSGQPLADPNKDDAVFLTFFTLNAMNYSVLPGIT